MYPIASAIASGSSTTLSFTSIPSNFTHLQVRVFGRSSNASSTTTLTMQLNSDTGSNYAWHDLSGSGASATSSSGINQTSMSFNNFVANTSTANVFNSSIIDILDYTSTNKNKTVKTFNGYDANGSGYIYLNSGLWFNATIASVTSLSLILTAGNWQSNSRADLYGITTSNVTGV
jgi:hypothetical protein